MVKRNTRTSMLVDLEANEAADPSGVAADRLEFVR